nr:DoxX family protein [Rhizobium sp. LCM 4573]
MMTMPAVRFAGLLALCSAYIQGPITKILDFPGAVAEMEHFHLLPGTLFAILVIGFELIASLLVLTGHLRWIASLALSVFTLLATLIAVRFWEVPPGYDRLMAMNAFFEHLGLAGAFLIVAWYDLRERRQAGAR